MRKTVLVALLVPLSLVAAACGDSKGSDLSDAEQAYADAIAVGLEEGKAGLTVPEDDIPCMAEAVVRGIGIEVFEEHDVEPERFEDPDGAPGAVLGSGVVTEEQATDVVDEWRDCTDLPALLGATYVPNDADGADCLADRLDDRLVDVLLLPTFLSEDGAVSDADDRDELIGLVTACAAGTDPTAFGDAEVDIDGGGSPSAPPADVESFLIEGLTASFSSGGTVDEATARCLAEGLVETIGADRLYEAAGAGLTFESADEAILAEIEASLQASAEGCDVPPELLTE